MKLGVKLIENGYKNVDDKQFPIVLHKDEYHIPKQGNNIVTIDDKVKFLEIYFATGNFTKSCKAILRDTKVMYRVLESDVAFGRDFMDIRNAIKHDLEQVMVENGRTPKGYMDRITWLRKNYPAEYNPESQKNPQIGAAVDAISQLAAKMKDYDLIPKERVIDVKDETEQL